MLLEASVSSVVSQQHELAAALCTRVAWAIAERQGSRIVTDKFSRVQSVRVTPAVAAHVKKYLVPTGFFNVRMDDRGDMVVDEADALRRLVDSRNDTIHASGGFKISLPVNNEGIVPDDRMAEAFEVLGKDTKALGTKPVTEGARATVSAAMAMRERLHALRDDVVTLVAAIRREPPQ
jgi:hypothetical protein